MKDEKGHGSNSRGGSNYARQAPTKNGRARMYGTSMADRIKIAQDRLLTPASFQLDDVDQFLAARGWLPGRDDPPLQKDRPPLSVRTLRSPGNPLGNAVAADALSSGGPKSEPAPVHDSMTHNDQGHAWGSPEALKDFSAKYSPKGFASGKRELVSQKNTENRRAKKRRDDMGWRG